MDFDSPDVERDFPGLYEGAEGKSKKSKEDSDSNHKKDKKDRGYEALEGDYSPEEDLDAKSPSKSKKSKTFMFTSVSKSKEKRDKPKERREKDKKEKIKEKDKKDKKIKIQQSFSLSEQVHELGDLQPVFGVSVSLATERSRCHDGVNIPLVVRDCIDYLQEHALKNEQIYKVEPMKTRLQHYKRLYNNRERQPETDELDIPIACGLLKLFLKELPEPVLTTDLMARFEEVASHPQVTKQQEELQSLLELLPSCNRNLLAWILLHFDAVIQNEKSNKMNAQSLAMLLSPPLQMSHRLLIALLCHCPNLFSSTKLIKYIPPITSSSPNLPDSVEEIQNELCKQESLLAQIHSEMNAGFVSDKREEQLWEVQRIITQLKRKLRTYEKKQEKSVEIISQTGSNNDTNDQKAISVHNNLLKQSKHSYSDDDSINTANSIPAAELTVSSEAKIIPQEATERHIPENKVKDPHETTDHNTDAIYIDKDTGFLMVSKSHPDYLNLIRLQLENQELQAWKAKLQTRIGSERAEILRLKHLYQQQLTTNAALKKNNHIPDENIAEGDYEKIIENYIRENALLEHKKNMLAKEIYEERRDCIALQVEIAMKQF